MKHILLPEAVNGIKYYRANLHCHSTISDGRKTVEELKRDYMKNGYSVIAFTDHEVFVPHNELSDENFLALNSVELSVNEEKRYDGEDSKTCHMCFIALDRDIKKDVCYHSQKYIGGRSAAYRSACEHDAEDFERDYTPRCINEMIRRGTENGFFVIYNHPAWSVESYPQFTSYKGLNAMEICNFSSVVSGWDDDNGHCYEDMLNGGERIFCVATDDNHNTHPDTSPYCDSYGGYTEIASPSLKYEDIADALKNGRFYASTGNYVDKGPEIRSLVYEDGKVTVKTSEAHKIQILYNVRRAGSVNAPSGETVNEAEFSLAENAKWFRVVVTDDKGYKAYSNAYFLDSLK